MLWFVECVAWKLRNLQWAAFVCLVWGVRVKKGMVNSV
jgi:hypothetical protein